MENKIKEIREYFTNIIVNGEYKVTEKTEHVWTILIDESFVFTLWIASGAFWLRTYENSLMHLDFTKEEKQVIWDKIELEVYVAQKSAKLELIEKLKLEIENS
jgi:hypothetical protein